MLGPRIGREPQQCLDTIAPAPHNRRITMDSTASSAQYPQAAALEESLKHLAIEVGDATAKPFRVDMVRVHGGKPPIYCVVIRSSAKEPDFIGGGIVR